MTHNRYMAFGMLAVALASCWCCSHAFHTINQSDALGIAVICTVASIVFSVYLIFSWKRQRVWVRSTRIARSSDPFSYWLAMTAFGLIDLVFSYTLAFEVYVLLKPKV